ncbi:hypothetical protein HFU84_12920 [Acidithiobacillus sp. CV18-2]|uniref:Uncharacterized protein n=1 Tax=Igneacidithiobacillus copahuensis TaxID=2724909 RepID=A0AAE2YP71_9PROT|nr:hypothetical protein [Igneacidithiobacillus copahuensis]MBU2754509.1 hypothetical protein [Acidithiobacillus sp. CV18-3]MBU2756814.1 hypothetical protein [Acidithiobacillus sp. BN09-2]MBU2778381.1 hypothetical protein [Acidithiobacillus sp. CV18-2]MBU2797652.1 hypothetical protein [Acidithiobacillus sp. VAN18-2]MBU2797981.1 hypothetical protein [Acidithiobacillus sp. VAN18-4]UTV80831.1 hypothetical protein MQE22_12585 [Acidithiobacillus sp. YTS05]
MTIKIIDCHIQGCGTGISAPKDAPLEVSGTTIIDCRKAIELRDQPSFLSALGLSADTPPAVLREVFEFLSQSGSDLQAIHGKAESSGLFRWLSAGADASTLVGALVSVAQSGLVQSMLAMLPR